MAEIVVTQLSKHHRGAGAALDDVSFTVPDGAICVVTGPNGSGKSTLLRLIANREAPTSGVIEIGDSVSQSFRLGRPDVVELIDPRALDPGRNLWDGLRAGPAEHGTSRREAEDAALRAADRMEIGPLLARRPRSISSGEAARAAFARAFARRPRALLLDEPFAGLDAARRFALRRELKRMNAEGRTIVIATHDHFDALALADMLVLLDAGRVVATGAPRELYERPASVDVARLVGAPPMNLLPVRANQTGLSLEDGTHLGGASVMTTQTFALLGVRPEHLFVAGEDAPPAAAILPVVVEAAEPAGHETLVHGRVGEFPVIGRVAGPVGTPASGPLKLGARRESLHMFDARSGARL